MSGRIWSWRKGRRHHCSLPKQESNSRDRKHFLPLDIRAYCFISFMFEDQDFTYAHVCGRGTSLLIIRSLFEPTQKYVSLLQNETFRIYSYGDC